jgi:biofilm PGA synthesis lipoprotein PgaB
MAMPYMEQQEDPDGWLEDLVAKVKSHGAMDRTLFHMQTVDWRYNMPVSTDNLARHFRLLMTLGAQHIAYYPDDFVTGHPSVQLVRSHLSVNRYPALAE